MEGPGIRFLSRLSQPTPGLEGRIGGRARSLTSLVELGLPVPDGFAVSDVVCRRYLETGRFPDGFEEELDEMLASIVSPVRPAMVAVRSSPPTPMPGLLANVLDVGTNEATLSHLARWSTPGVAATTHQRFLRGYAGTVRAVPMRHLDRVGGDDPAALQTLIEDESQRPIPTDLATQTGEALQAIFASWDGGEARGWRRRRRISDDSGTGAVIHLMTFGDLDADSGVGVFFSRDPSDGSPRHRGVYSRQGERPQSAVRYGDTGDLAAANPRAHAELSDVADRLEADTTDAVRIDYVLERGDLWVIEARPAERSATAAVRIAVDLADAGVIDQGTALARVEADRLGELLHGQLAPHEARPIARGVGAAPGGASGPIVFDAGDVAIDARPILVRREATAEDIEALPDCAGLLTVHGGRTSHPAVVARGLGTPAVIGATGIVIDHDAQTLASGDQVFGRGDVVTIDGTTGEIFAGGLDIVPPAATDHLDRLLAWADDVRTMEVWGNADTPDVATVARTAGATGLGLVRTEYMFAGERLEVMQSMLLAQTPRAEADALEKLERLQVGDFERLLEVMDGLPVVVRLLDPPLHEFLPDSRDLDADNLALAPLLDALDESNPMLGLRGVRLAVVKPAIYRVQVLAALEAVRRRLDAGGDPRLSLMIPLVGTVEELHLVRDMIDEEVHYAGRQLEVAIGTMIELPRAALVADRIAIESDFFSFGTNDLTQTTLGLSRDDAEEAFLERYLEQGLFEANPFQTLDDAGVGRLISMAIQDGRRINPELEIGVCGEHGADPRSIAYFHRMGVDYVSCSPPRIPVARLAAAQAALADVTP